MGRRSSPRGRDDSRGQSTSRRSSGDQGGKKEQGSISLLVRNIPYDCSSDLLVAFQKFGRIRDFYIPKDYHSGEPRGFAFVEYWDSRDASDAQRHMNHKMVCGREINVVPAVGKRKRPDGLSRESGVRGHSDYKGRQLSRHGRPRSRSLSRSPRRGGRDRSRSHSPAPRRRRDYSASPKRKEERQTKSSGHSKEDDKGKKQEPCTPIDRSDRHDADNDSNARRATPDYSVAPKRTEDYHTKSLGQAKKHDEDKRQRSYTPADRNDCREDRNGHNERDDYSTSPKRKEERLPKSPRLSKEHNNDKKRRSYSRDDGNDCCDADIGLKERRATNDGEGSCPRQRSPRPSSGSHSRRRDDYSASPKGNKEHQEQSPRHSKEYGKCKKRRSNTPDNRNDNRDADHSYIEIQDDHPTSPKIKDKRQAKSSGESKEYDKDANRISYAPHDRNDRRDSDKSSKDSNVHVDRKPVTPDGEESHDGRRSPRPSTRSSSRRQDDYASAKIKEELRAKSPKQSNEHEDKKRRSYTPDDKNDRCDADNCNKKKPVTPDGEGSHDRPRSPGPSTRSSSRSQDDYSASAKIKEELRAKSPKQSNKHEDKKRRSSTPDDRNDRCDADNCNKKKQDDDSASPKRKEEYRAKSPRQTKEREVKMRSYAPDDRIDRHEADNGYNERRASPDNGSPKRTEEPRQAKSQSQSNEHGNDKNQRSYTRDDGKDRCNADSASKERNDYPASRNKKEEERGQNFRRQSKEHDENKRGSFTPGDRNDYHNNDNDNGSKERDDNSASQKRMKDHRAKSPRQSKEHDNDKKRGSYAHDNRKDHCDADNVSRERRDDYLASGNGKEERRAKSPRQSKEHDDSKKRGSFTPDDRNDHHDTDNGSKKRRDDNSATRKRMEDHRAKSPRQSKEYENDKKRGSYTRDDRKDRCDAENGSRERDDYSASRNRMEDHRAKSPRQSKEHENDKKRGSCTHDDRKDRCDRDNGSRERDDYSASRKRMEDHRAKSPRQSKEHENDKKRGSYTHDDRKDRCDRDNGSRERRDGYVASRKRKEECRGKSPRQSKEHDENRKSGSYVPDDRNDPHDADNGCNEKLATPDGEGSHPSPRRRSTQPTSVSCSRSGDETRGRRSD